MFFESSPRLLQRICGPLERGISVFISWGNFLPLLLYSPDASLYFNKPWMSDGYSLHTGSQKPYRCTTLPLTALYQREAALCKLHWPLFLTPDGPPLLTSFLLPFFQPSLSELFFLCSCHVAERGSRHPSDHPHAQTPTESPWKPSPAPRERNRRSSPDRAQCKWGIDGEGEMGRCWKWAQGRNSCPNFLKTSPWITLLEKFQRDKVKADVS